MPLNLLWLLLCDLAIPLRDFTQNYVPVHIHPVIPARDPHDAAMIAKEQERPNVSILLFQPDPLCALSPGAPLPPTCLSSSPSQGLDNSEPCPAPTEAHHCLGPAGLPAPASHRGAKEASSFDEIFKLHASFRRKLGRRNISEREAPQRLPCKIQAWGQGWGPEQHQPEQTNKPHHSRSICWP